MKISSPDTYIRITREDVRKIPVIVVVGPTAVGKTGISIDIAANLDGEIVSADSRLFYRGMDIGTAKPTQQDRLRVPHHLIDITNPDETWSLSLFQQAAKSAIKEILCRHHLPIIVGGTGQYIHAIIHGWKPPNVAPDQKIRQDLEELTNQNGILWLHERLQRLDPEAALKIDPRNIRRIIRALEVIKLTGRKFSAQGERSESPYHPFIIGLTRPRSELYSRVDERIEQMFSAGFLEEVERLLRAGYSPDLPAMTSIGYRECISVLQGVLTLEEAKRRIRKLTRIFVRRQYNWFKLNDPAIHWFDPGITNISVIEKSIQDFLIREKA